MTRNGGRNKHGRGHTAFIRCSNCGKCCPKDLNCKMVSRDDDDIAAPVPLSSDNIAEIQCFINIMDHLLACEATWHMGEPLTDTVYSFIYMSKLGSLSDYNLLYSLCGVTAATCCYAVKSEEEKDFLANLHKVDADADILKKLEELEDFLSVKVKACEAPCPAKLYDAALQRILFRKFYYLTLKDMRKPIGKAESLAKVYLARCKSALTLICESEEFLQSTNGVSEIVKEQTTACGCKPIGFRKCDVQILSWEEAVNHFKKLLGDLDTIFSYPIDGGLNRAIQITIDFHRRQPNVIALNSLKLILLQDGKLYGSEPIMSIVLKASLLPEDSKYNVIVESENVAQVGKCLVELLQVLCEDIKIQRDSLEETINDWKCLCDKLENEYKMLGKSSNSSKRSSKKLGLNILMSIGRFVLEQTTWILLRFLTLGFETKLYSPDDYAMIYWSMSQSQKKLYDLIEYKEKEAGKEKHERKKEGKNVVLAYPYAKLFWCYYNVSVGLFEVLVYLRTRWELFLCPYEEKRFKKFLPFGFSYKDFKRQTKAGIRASDLISSTFMAFDTAYKTSIEIEANFVNDPFTSNELMKLKKVAFRNSIAAKAIASLNNASDRPEFSLELIDHSHFASIIVKRK